ncbi:hypothetical protein XELAEV_18016748mg [Xenopus laevis]|uniref:Helix-turn-helix domain-containing protein n=1 Tax=Xenopus laevis TaxID=8355 RepID=A0A974D9T5_XENLA|nr:hypothetical protein XELAEV_18016748mg [Xenopus laevis]
MFDTIVDVNNFVRRVVLKKHFLQIRQEGGLLTSEGENGQQINEINGRFRNKSDFYPRQLRGPLVEQFQRKVGESLSEFSNTVKEQDSKLTKAITIPTFYHLPKVHKKERPPLGDQSSVRPHLSRVQIAWGTLDVVSSYSSIPHDKGICAIQYHLTKFSDYSRELIHFMLDAVRFLLEHNYFIFDANFYLQKRGTTMGFTSQFSLNKIEFLDVMLLVEGNAINTSIFRKPCSGNTLLHASSCQLNKLIEGIHVGQFLRLRRNCSTNGDFGWQAQDMRSRFLERGYKQKTIRKAFQGKKGSV